MLQGDLSPERWLESMQTYCLCPYSAREADAMRRLAEHLSRSELAETRRLLQHVVRCATQE